MRPHGWEETHPHEVQLKDYIVEGERLRLGAAAPRYDCSEALITCLNAVNYA